MKTIHQKLIERKQVTRDEGTMGFHDYVTEKEPMNKFIERVTIEANDIIKNEYYEKTRTVLNISYAEDYAIIVYNESEV